VVAPAGRAGRWRPICRGLITAAIWVAAALLVVWLVLGPHRLVYRVLSWLWSLRW